MRLRLTIYYVKCSDGQPFLITGKEVEHEHKKGISIFGSYIGYSFFVLCRFRPAAAPAGFGDWHDGLKHSGRW